MRHWPHSIGQHGKSKERKAHQCFYGPGRKPVVQKGIIDYYRSLRQELQAEVVLLDLMGMSQPGLKPWFLDQFRSEAIDRTLTFVL